MVVRLGRPTSAAVAHSSPSAPSSTGGSTDGVGTRDAGHASTPVGGGQLPAGAVDVLAAGVAHRRRDAGGAQPRDELALGRAAGWRPTGCPASG